MLAPLSQNFVLTWILLKKIVFTEGIRDWSEFNSDDHTAVAA
jgi:hypothetical protein